jgi:hypothetical protein
MTLDRFLDNLHPTRIIDPIRRVFDQALETFPHKVSRITRWPEFQYWFVLLCRHCEATFLGLQDTEPRCSIDFDWRQLRRYLIASFGSSGDLAGFEIARTGSEGGLITVAREVTRAIGNEYIDNHISVHVWSYWNTLSIDEKLSAGDEFLARCGHLYPEEMKEGSAARIRANLPQVLMQYPHLLDRIRRTVHTGAQQGHGSQ